MAVKVVDSSAISALVYEEPEADQIDRIIDGHTLIAPTLLRYELANVCLTKARRHPVLRDRLWAAFGLVDGLAITLMTVNHAEALDLGHAWKLTAYDTSYLWLADHTGAELVTLDRRLAAADAALRARRLC